jgi:hypothetical protein
MNETLPFAALDEFLQKLGFEKIVVPKSHIGYRHADSDTIFMFRLYKPHDPVDRVNRASVRKLLLERGLIEPEDWDELLKAKSA